MIDAHCAKWAMVPHTEGTTVCHVLLCRLGLLIGREGFARGSGSPKRDGRGAAPVVPEFKHRGSVISHSIEDIGRDLGETICRLPRMLHGRAREARCTQVRSAGAHGCQGVRASRP